MGSQDFTASYGIEIDVDGTDSAEDAAKALENLRESIAGDTVALGEMQKALRQMQGGTVVSAQAFRTLRKEIAAKKESLAQASQQMVLYRSKFPGAIDAVKKARAAEKEHAGAVKALRGELFGAEHQILGLRMSTLRSVGPALALAAGYTALAIAVGVAAVAVFKFGLASGDARRTEAIDIQAAGTRIWYGYGQAVMFAADETEKGAKAIEGALDRISNVSTVGRERIAGFARELEGAGLRGKALETSLRAVSRAASVGKEAGLVQMFGALRFAGQGVDTLAARIETKLGPLVDRKLLALDSQFQRLRENFALLFKNVDMTPILRALDRVLGLFSQTKVVGYALRIALEQLFPTKSAITFGEVAAQVIKETVIWGLRLELGFLTLELMYYKLRNAAKKAFDVDIVRAWWSVFKETLAGTVDALSKIVPGLNVIRGIYDIGKDMGGSIADGVVDGVREGIPSVENATKAMGTGAEKSFKNKLEIRSPSRVFEDAGEQVPAGAARGIAKGAGDVQDAADRAGPSPRAGGAKGAGIQLAVHFHEGAIKVTGNAPAEFMQDIEDQMSAALERAAQKFGALLETT